ncbi:MAG: hypothetical protein ABIB71_04665 [Candidatus Woesearchaeota archaeon]
MEKKGASHADWAISLGIFLIYILSLFLIIQPGVEPIYREDTLIKIVENAFMGEMNLTMTRTVFILNTTGQHMESFIGERLFLAYSGEGLPFDPNQKAQYNLNSSDGLSSSSNFGESANELYFLSKWIENDDYYKFWIDYSQDYTYDNAAGNYDGSPDDCITNFLGGIGGCLARPAGAKNFTLTLGTTEVLKGLSKSKIDAFKDASNKGCLSSAYSGEPKAAAKEGFKAIKEGWNFPVNKEFSISYVVGSSPIYSPEDIIPVCDISKPSNQTSAFVKEIGSWLVDEDGTKTPIRVNIKVW